MKKKITLFIILVFLTAIIINNIPVTAKGFEGGPAPKQVQNLANMMKNKYMKPLKKTVQMNSVPKLDSNFEHNKGFCRSYNKEKIEYIGTLKCLPGGINVAYEKKGSNSKALFIYFTYGLISVVNEIGSGYPKARYLYRAKYPNATYEKAKVLMSGGNKLAFDKNGKINAFLFKGQCYKENDKGQMVELRYAKNLCSDVIEMGYFDGYKKLPVPPSF